MPSLLRRSPLTARPPRRSLARRRVTLPTLRVRIFAFFYFLLSTFYFTDRAFAEAPKKEERVTQVIREVNLLPAAAPPRRAVLNENVVESTAVKTGGDSRAELTFIDLTITRLGANTLYSFKHAGRRVELSSGSTLLRVPKGSGGATIYSSAVTTGITGTTLIFESTRAGGARLTVLEGSARLTLLKHRDQAGDVRAGQSLEVPPGTTRIPAPKEIDLDRLMKTSPLIVGFPPSAHSEFDQQRHSPAATARSIQSTQPQRSFRSAEPGSGTAAGSRSSLTASSGLQFHIQRSAACPERVEWVARLASSRPQSSIINPPCSPLVSPCHAVALAEAGPSSVRRPPWHAVALREGGCPPTRSYFDSQLPICSPSPILVFYFLISTF